MSDPCANCTQLEIRAGMRPWCIRGANYGSVGCLRKASREVADPLAGREETRRAKRVPPKRRTVNGRSWS